MTKNNIWDLDVFVQHSFKKQRRNDNGKEKMRSL